MSSVNTIFLLPCLAVVLSPKEKGELKACETQAKRTRTGTNQRAAVLLKHDEWTEGTRVALFYWLPRVWLLFRFEETSVRVTYRPHNVSIVEKLCRWIFPMKIKSYTGSDGTKVFVE